MGSKGARGDAFFSIVSLVICSSLISRSSYGENSCKNALGMIEPLQFKTWLLKINLLQFQKQTPTILNTFLVIETFCR
jgi:hypothetical protein